MVKMLSIKHFTFFKGKYLFFKNALIKAGRDRVAARQALEFAAYFWPVLADLPSHKIALMSGRNTLFLHFYIVTFIFCFRNPGFPASISSLTTCNYNIQKVEQSTISELIIQ